VHSDHVEQVGADVVVGAELGGDVLGLGRRPSADEVLVDQRLHGERVAAPEHVRLQPTRAHVGRHPRVQLAGRRPEQLDPGTGRAVFEGRDHGLDRLVAQARVEGDGLGFRVGFGLPGAGVRPAAGGEQHRHDSER
jgi:hypothetical protein